MPVSRYPGMSLDKTAMILAPPDEFKLLADNAPVMIWRVGPDLSYDWFNRPWLCFIGQPIEAAIGGRGSADFIHPADRDRYQSALSAAFAAREPFSLEYRLRRRDGVFRWILDNGSPYERNGEFAGFLGSCVDITDHRSIEKNLQAAIEERTVLLREVHHRVKNNFQTLMALVRFMRRSTDADGRALLDILYARLVSMSLVHGYLHASDNMTEVSFRTLLGAIVPQIAETVLVATLELVESPGDFILPAQLAGFAGLAVAEAIVLLTQNGASAIEIKLRNDSQPIVEVTAAVNGSELIRSQLGMRLVLQYARGAGAEPDCLTRENKITLLFLFPKSASP